MRSIEPAPLSYVACVSYPRSGHHVTERVLGEYFGPRFRYCEFYKPAAGECCKEFPCRKPGMTMSKSHDFGLLGFLGRGDRVVPSIQYLVLIRNFLEAAVSEYEMLQREPNATPDSEAKWQEFVSGRMKFYRRFSEKWVLGGADARRHIVRYEDLTARPGAMLEEVVRLFDPHSPVDSARLQSCIEQVSALSVGPMGVKFEARQGIRNRRSLEAFRWYEADSFGRIERKLGDLLERLGYRARFGGDASATGNGVVR